MHEATRVILAGMPDPMQGEPFLPGPTFAGAYHFAGEQETSPYTYGRYHNPTWTRFEQALSELEGGPTLVFASGMAAITAVFSVTLAADSSSPQPASVAFAPPRRGVLDGRETPSPLVSSV